MAQVDFYVLGQSDEQARYSLACRIAEKAWRLENTIHIHTMTEDNARHLDELLWTFRDGSFVPHDLLNAESDAPVTIGYGNSTVEPRDLLITLCDEIPAFADSFPRIAELVSADDACRSRGRQRYALYREQGHKLEKHDI